MNYYRSLKAMKSVNFPWSTKLEYLTVWIFIPYWSVKFKFTCTVWIFFLFLFFIMCRCCSWQHFFDQYGYMTSIFKFLNVWNKCNLILRIIIAQRRMHGKPLWIFSFQDFIRICFGVGMKEVEVHPKEFTWLINCDSPTDGSADIF